MPLSNLLNDLLTDIRDPHLLWQAGAIALCVGLGWFLARLIRSNIGKGSAEEGRRGVVRAGVASFGHVLAPLLIAGLIFVSTLALKPFLHNVHLLRVALPVFG